VYDVAGLDHMDVFVFDQNGLEVDSTVSSELLDGIPCGAGYTPTTADSPHAVTILDGNDFEELTLPTTVWVNVSDSGPDAVGYSTFHLDVST
jgi:hypothetical protein